MFYRVFFNCLLFGCIQVLQINFPPNLFTATEDTQWNFVDCGPIVLVDKGMASDSQGHYEMAYYVTYISELYNKEKTQKVTPSSYKTALSRYEKQENICFDVELESKANYRLGYSLLTVLKIFIGFNVLRILYFTLRNKQFSYWLFNS
jgi:hypothetical protein